MITPEEHRLLLSDAIEGKTTKVCGFLKSKLCAHFVQSLRRKYRNGSHSTDAGDDAIRLADAVRELLEHDEVDLNVKRRLGRTTLLHATCFNNVIVVRELLRHNTVDINTRDRDKKTPLILASETGDVEFVRELLKHDMVDVNATCPSGRALTVAVKRGHAEVVSDLLNDKRMKMNARNLKRLATLVFTKKKDDQNQNDSRIVRELSQAILLWASEHGYAEMVRELIKHEGLDLNLRAHRGRTPLIVASEWGRIKVVSELLKVQAVDVNAQDDDGRTSLIMASSVGHVKMVLELLKHPKVIVDAKDNTGRSALIWAGELGHMQVVRALLKNARVDVSSQNDNGCTSLMSRIREGQVTVFRQSLNAPNLVANTKNDQGTPALILANGLGHSGRMRDVSNVGKFDIFKAGIGLSTRMIASDRGFAGIVGELLSLSTVNMNVNVDSVYDVNALVSASHGGHAKVVHALSSRSLFMANKRGRADVDGGLMKRVKVDMNAMTSRGRTALTLASANEDLRIGEVMRFMNASTAGNDGWTALCIASGEGHVGVLLRKNDEDVRDRDDDNTTDLIPTSVGAHLGAIRELLNHNNVHVNAKREDGTIALVLASGMGHLEVVCQSSEYEGVDLTADG
jgi:ankyrin repeat protein